MATGDFIPEIWTANLLKNWDESFVMMRVVNRNLEGDIKGPGSKLHALDLGDITVGDYTDAAGVTWEDIPEGTDAMDIDQQKYFAFLVKDIQKIQSKPELMKNYTRRANIAMQRTYERYLLGSSIYGVFTNTLDYTTGGVGALSTSNVYSMLVSARRLMEDDNTWQEGQMWMAAPPRLLQLIRTGTELVHATETADKFIRDGSIMKLAGWNLLPVAESNMTGSGTDVSPLKMIGGNTEAIHFAEQISEIEDVRREDYFQTGIKGLNVFGAKVFTQNANAGICIDVEF